MGGSGNKRFAKELNGVWTTGNDTLKNSDGDNVNCYVNYTFNYDSVTNKNGGSFVEDISIIVHHQNNYVMADGMVNSSVTGEWKIVSNNLQLAYNLASLDVEVGYYNLHLSNDAVGIYKEDYEDACDGDWGEQWLNETFALNESTENSKSYYYKTIRQRCQEINEKTITVQNFDVKYDTMFFDVKDVAALTFTRTTKEKVVEKKEEIISLWNEIKQMTVQIRPKKVKLPQPYQKGINGYTFHADSGSVKLKWTWGWGEWSEWSKLNIKFDINFNANTLTVYHLENGESETFRLINWQGLTYDRDGSEKSNFTFGDNTGSFKGYFRKQPNGIFQFYLSFPGQMRVYGLDELKPY